MKMMGVSAVVSGSMPSKVQGCPWIKAAPRVSPMYLWHPNSSLSSLITCIVRAYSHTAGCTLNWPKTADRGPRSCLISQHAYFDVWMTSTKIVLFMCLLCL